MSKYIVDIDDFEPHFKVDSIGVFGIGKSLSYSEEDHSWSRIKSIEEFEELNSDYINEHYGQMQDEAYQAGLNDAWEAAKKLFSSMADSDIEKAFPIEWNNGGFKALMNLQPQEAIAKLKAYEHKDSDRIEVGDEVIWTTDNITLIVTSTYEVGGINWCDGLAQDGKVYSTLIEKDRKTGKHYDIQSILEAMRK